MAMRALETSHFGPVSREKMSSQCPLHLKHRFLDLYKVEFRACQDTENDFLVPFDHLNHRFIELKKITISIGQGAKNDVKVTFDNLNHRFVDFIKLHFRLVQRPKIFSDAMRPP